MRLRANRSKHDNWDEAWEIGKEGTGRKNETCNGRGAARTVVRWGMRTRLPKWGFQVGDWASVCTIAYLRLGTSPAIQPLVAVWEEAADPRGIHNLHDLVAVFSGLVRGREGRG